MTASADLQRLSKFLLAVPWHEHGHPFFHCANGVRLTDAVPPAYLEEAAGA